MNGELIIFLILAIIAISGSFLVITLNRIAHRVTSMIFVFFAVAGLYFLLRAEFIGILQIMVYVGALSILFVFGMMMTEHKVAATQGPKRSQAQKLVSLVGIAVLLLLMLQGIFTLDFPNSEEYYMVNAGSIGMELYGNYVIAFQAAGILLLAALIGAIVLARKEAK